MKTWAKLDNQNTVTNILKFSDEKKNVKKWLEERFGGKWVQTFTLEDLEKGLDQKRFFNPASIGFFWDEKNQAFIPPKPFDSWILNDEFQWESPIQKPKGNYFWDEKTTNWVEVTEEN